MPMMRQFFFRGLFLGAVVVGSTGCESLHSMVRPNDKDQVSSKDDNDDSKAVGSDASKLRSVDSTGKNSQPFFSPTRNRSAFSSFSPEAQDIEKNLGVF
jgi:hypothetical protein